MQRDPGDWSPGLKRWMTVKRQPSACATETSLSRLYEHTDLRVLDYPASGHVFSQSHLVYATAANGKGSGIAKQAV